MSDWIVPVKGTTYYPLNSNTFYITTESVTGGSDRVDFWLYPGSGGDWITNIFWRFEDWGYIISYCTPYAYSLKFPVTPPTGINKTWEVTITKEDLKIKCNTVQVLHFIINNKHNADCTRRVKGKIATRIRFYSYDTATKMFKSDQAGK